MSKAFLIRATFLSIAVVMLILFMRNCVNGHLKNQYAQQLLIEGLQAKLKISYDAQGHQIAEKRVITLAYKDLKKLRVDDSSEIGRLKKLVKKNTTSATIVNTTTSGTLIGKTNIVFVDGPVKDYDQPCDTIYPVYTNTLTDAWTNIAITASKDSVSAIYTTYNVFEFTHETKMQGRWPFKKPVPVVMVKSLNPHTQTTGISAYAVPTPNYKKKIAIGTGVGFGLGVIAVKVIKSIFLK